MNSHLYLAIYLPSQPWIWLLLLFFTYIKSYCLFSLCILCTSLLFSKLTIYVYFSITFWSILNTIYSTKLILNVEFYSSCVGTDNPELFFRRLLSVRSLMLLPLQWSINTSPFYLCVCDKLDSFYGVPLTTILLATWLETSGKALISKSAWMQCVVNLNHFVCRLRPSHVARKS